MIEAEKFHTGFDQPRLVAKFVEKKLGGMQAVQTPSRLNHAHPGRETTFVFDFRNEPRAILDAFVPYSRKAKLTTTTDPNLIDIVTSKLDVAGIYTMAEVHQAYDAALVGGVNANSAVSAAVAPAVDRFEKRWFDAVPGADQVVQERQYFFRRIYPQLSTATYEDRSTSRRSSSPVTRSARASRCS